MILLPDTNRISFIVDALVMKRSKMALGYDFSSDPEKNGKVFIRTSFGAR